MATFNRRGYKKSRTKTVNQGEKSQTAEVFDSLDSTANKSEQWILKNQNENFFSYCANFIVCSILFGIPEIYFRT